MCCVQMGYASRVMELLNSYYEGKLTNLDESDDEVNNERGNKKKQKMEVDEKGQDVLHSEVPRPRKNLPPLLTPINDERRLL